MNIKILVLFLIISGFANSQQDQNSIIGEWFSCTQRDYNVGDTINLQRDSCVINYEHKAMQFKIQVSFAFAKNHFSLYKNSGVIEGGTYYRYWEIKNGTSIFIGIDENEILEQYEILSMNSYELILLKMK